MPEELNIAERERMVVLAAERARRRMDALCLYRPMPSQLAFHKSMATERGCRGGTRSGRIRSNEPRKRGHRQSLGIFFELNHDLIGIGTHVNSMHYGAESCCANLQRVQVGSETGKKEIPVVIGGGFTRRRTPQTVVSERPTQRDT